MKKFFIILFLSITSSAFSQIGDYYKKNNLERINLILGFNAIDDDDSPFKDVINPKTLSYNVYPSKVGILYEMDKKLFLESSVMFTKMKKNVSQKYTEPYNCFSFDINAQYHFNLYKKIDYTKYGVELFKTKKWISFYPISGLSLNLRSQTGSNLSLNLNIGSGLNWWVLSNKLAINGQSMAQFGLFDGNFKSNTNMIRYSLGVIYKK